MRYSAQIRPISYLKANTTEILLDLADSGGPLVITQNGEAKAVLQSVSAYEDDQATLALLKLLALGNRDIEAGHVVPAREVIARLKARSSSAQ